MKSYLISTLLIITFFSSKAQGWHRIYEGGPGTIPIGTICTDPSGNLYVAGDYADGSNYPEVNKWNGSTWSQVGSMAVNWSGTIILSICSDASGNIYAAGGFVDTTTGFGFITKWNAASWSRV